MPIYRWLADAVVAFHLGYVLFVVFGLAAVLLGIVLRWSWIRNFWFRAIHFVMIGIVVAEAACGVRCPLTTWEKALRKAAGEEVEQASFVGRWAREILFVDVTEDEMGPYYYAFGAVVLLTFLAAPPRLPRRRSSSPAERPPPVG